jgi:hypothetical protein
MWDASDLFKLLASRSRRRVLVMLCETETLRVPDDVLTRGRTAREPTPGGAGPRHAPREDGDSFELQLRHTHLPKLESAGLVEWDREADLVTRGPRFDDVEPAVRSIVENADRFPPDLF